jgi:hypothetical protein
MTLLGVRTYLDLAGRLELELWWVKPGLFRLAHCSKTTTTRLERSIKTEKRRVGAKSQD